MASNWDQLDKSTSSEQRQCLYKFLICSQGAVRELIKHLTADEAGQMLSALSNADDRKNKRPTKDQRRRLQNEIEAILS